MLVVALTGGIGSGKSTACNYFKTLGTPVIDADEIAHTITQPGTPALKAISEHFGADVLDQQGALLRTQLREIIFNDPTKRRWLEALLHPLIREQMHQQLQALKNHPYCIVAIPLLTTKTPINYIDRICVIDLPAELQCTRASARDQVCEQHIDLIIQAQQARTQRLDLADDILYNDKDIAFLKQQIDRLHQRYLTLGITRRHP